MRYLAVLMCLCFLAACGQKGSLYLPTKKSPTTQPSPISQP
mgnify:CR=1 FL=1